MKTMTNKLNELIRNYSACGMLRELSGTTSFELAASCRYVNKKGSVVYCNHQWCVRRTALNQILEALTQQQNKIAEAKDFEGIYKIVQDTKVPYIGLLTQYDIAMRVGYLQSPKVLPQNLVYIHAGAEKGAKALYQKGLLKNKPSRTMSINDFEFLSELKNLDKEKHGIPEDATFAMLVEDFLCIKHNELEALSTK